MLIKPFLSKNLQKIVQLKFGDFIICRAYFYWKHGNRNRNIQTGDAGYDNNSFNH